MGGIVKTHIDKIAAGGAGIAQIQGKKVFIQGTIPGETVVCRISREHRTWTEAELLEVVDASPERISPLCVSCGICGGCNLQHLSYRQQLEVKTGILKDCFGRIGGISLPEVKYCPSEPWNYRNRMQFHVARNGNKAVFFGLKAQKSNEIIAVPDCPVADPGLRKLLKNQAAKTSAFSLPHGKDRFTVYTKNDLLLVEGIQGKGKIQILDMTLSLDASVFFQSNSMALELLIADLLGIASLADQSSAMSDLYCGVGTFAAFLGHLFPRIDLVEENKAALSLARENLSNYRKVDFFAQQSEDWAKNRDLHHGFMVVDPPRQGLHPALTSHLAEKGPPVLVYVSCDPATLARDSKILLEGQYELHTLNWYDFYPQTAHLEILAVFIKSH